MSSIFKNCGLPNYTTQLLRLSPKTHFLFSEFLCQGEGVEFYNYILKKNKFIHKNLYNPSYNQITLFLIVNMFPGKISDISYSKFLEGYISNNNHTKSSKWVYNWLMKWHSFSLMDNTSLSFYLMTCKTGLPCKVNDLEIALWASKNVQILLALLQKSFNLITSINPSIYPSSFTNVRFWTNIEISNVVNCRWKLSKFCKLCRGIMVGPW